MKRLTAMLLVLVLLLGLLAGCGSQQESSTEAGSASTSAETASSSSATAEESAPAQEPVSTTSASEEAVEESAGEASGVYPLSDTPVEISYWGGDLSSSNSALPTYSNMEAYAFWDYVEQETGVKLVLNLVSMQMEQEQTGLMLASGDYSDIMAVNGSYVSGGINTLLADGIVEDLAPYVEAYMPNYYAFISESEEKTKLAYDDDGQMAGLRSYAEYYVPNQGLMIRQDWLDALGLDTPTTISGLYEVLTAFKTEYGVSSPMWMSTTGQNATHIVGALGSIGFAQDMGSTTDYLYVSGGQVCASLLDENYLEYLTLMHQWYEEGLFLEDFAMQTDMDAQNTAVLNEQVGVFNAMYGQALTVQDSLQSLNANANIRAIPTPTTDDGKENAFYSFSPLSNTAYKCVSSATEDLELVMRYMDWWYSEDGYLTANYGVEGLSYELDETGEPRYSELVTNNEWGIDAASAIEAYVTTNPILGLVSMDRSVYLVGEDWVEEMLDVWVQQCNDENSLSSGVMLTTEESSTVAALSGDIATHASTAILQFITGARDLSEWNDFQQEVLDMGLQTIVDTYQAAYERYLAR